MDDESKANTPGFCLPSGSVQRACLRIAEVLCTPGGHPKSNQQFDEFNFIKEKQVEVLRGNGTIISSAALLNPLLMFKNPNFEFID